MPFKPFPTMNSKQKKHVIVFEMKESFQRFLCMNTTRYVLIEALGNHKAHKTFFSRILIPELGLLKQSNYASTSLKEGLLRWKRKIYDIFCYLRCMKKEYSMSTSMCLNSKARKTNKYAEKYVPKVRKLYWDRIYTCIT